MAYYVDVLDNPDTTIGAGRIGELQIPMEEYAFLSHLKECMGLQYIKHTPLLGKTVQKVRTH